MKKILFISILLLFCFISSQGQLKVLSSGNVQIGGSSANTGAALNLYGNDEVTLRSDVYFSFGWGDAIKSTLNRSDGIAFSAWYNGNRNFKVFGDGDVWCVNLYESSDIRLKENIKPIENALNKVLQLDGVTYNFKDYNPNDKKSIKEKTGLIAQNVEPVLPEVIITSPDGDKAVAYSKIVPVLIEAIKELEAKVESLENDCCNSATKTKSAIINNTEGTNFPTQAELYQNSPNPFSQETVIRFYIPPTVKSAQLHICNMTGTLLKKRQISQREAGQENISCNLLKPGMYLYSLVCDGKIVETKQMLLTM